VGDFTEAIRLGVDEALVWYGRAQARGLLQEFAEADRDYTEALKRSPGWVSCLVRRGELRWTWGRARGRPDMYFQAAEDLEAAVRLAPSSVEAWHELGLARSSIASEVARDALEAIRYERGAVEAFEKVTALQPGVGRNWTFLGGTQVNLGLYLSHAGESPLAMWRAAIETLDRSLKLDAEDPTTWRFRGNGFINRADYLMSAGKDGKPDYAEALKCFEKAGELHPGMKAALRDSVERCRRGLRP
jgi:tetratricopeptide (TPR) repeat protein